MKAIIRPHTTSVVFHVLLWSLLLLLPYIVSSGDNHYKIGAIPGLFFTISGFIHAAIFYGNAFYLYPSFLNKRFWWLYIITVAVLIAGSFQLKHWMLINWFPYVSTNSSTTKFIYGPSVATFITSIVYRKVIDQVRLERQLKERQTAQLETELKFLRSQINPHFLFNVLTNLVSLARKKSDKLEQSLIMLSELMRYTLSTAESKKSTLQKEMIYLNSYIELQKLRFGNEISIDCDINLSDTDGSYPIEPMLLIPFVENAYEHGAGAHEKAWITVRLSVTNGLMNYEVSNYYESMPATNGEVSGIGINNVKSRLHLLYHDRYNLAINDKNNIFQIVLTLKLT